jgi:hypothetical protein
MTGRTLFISPAGNDGWDGLSARHAWRTLDRVSKEEHLEPGDRVLLQEGAIFEGSLTLTTGGTPSQPVVIESQGKPATIHSPRETAITISTGGIEIRNLMVTGAATAKQAGHDGVLLAAPGNAKCKHVVLERLDVSGFGNSGIRMTGAARSLLGFDDVRIDRVKVHGCYSTGLAISDGVASDAKGYAHHNLLLTDCDVSDNLDGNGIILSGVDGATVEYCHAAGNRNGEGAVGMWCWCAKNVTFRYCIASHTHGKTDAGGFDLDGGSVDCVMEHCLSFDNDGPGYMHCDYPEAPRTERNVFRSCISLNDGRRSGPFGFGFVVWGTGLYDCRIERNLAILTTPDLEVGHNGMLFATFIRTESLPMTEQRLEGALFLGNRVFISAKGADYVSNNFPFRKAGDLTFRANQYESTVPAWFVEGPAGERKSYTAAEWQKMTGDEKSPPTGWPDHAIWKKLQPRDLPSLFQRLGM